MLLLAFLFFLPFFFFKITTKKCQCALVGGCGGRKPGALWVSIRALLHRTNTKDAFDLEAGKTGALGSRERMQSPGFGEDRVRALGGKPHRLAGPGIPPDRRVQTRAERVRGRVARFWSRGGAPRPEEPGWVVPTPPRPIPAAPAPQPRSPATQAHL